MDRCRDVARLGRRQFVALGLAAAGCAGMNPRPAPSVDPTRPLGEVLQAVVPTLLDRNGVPGLGFARYRQGQVDIALAFGRQDAETPATPQTLFNPASLTKPVSADIFLRVASERGLDLDAPVAPFWIDPDVADDPRSQRLTPRMLLSHRSGFANWRSQTGGVLRFRDEPGRTFGYSGEGYEYLGHVLKALTGEDLERLARRHLFEPEAMRTTSYVRQHWFDGRLAIPWDGSWLDPSIQSSPVASDDIWTTPHDYALFMGSVMRGTGISNDLLRQRLTVQTDRRAVLCDFRETHLCPTAVGMGLGWEVQTYPHTTILMHTGNDRGTFAFAAIDMARQEAVVLMTNGAAGGAVAVELVPYLGLDPAFTSFLGRLAAG